MIEPATLLSDGSLVRLLVGATSQDGLAVGAGATGCVLSSSDAALTYCVQLDEPAGAIVVIAAADIEPDC